MNKIFTDYVQNVRKRLLTDRIGEIDCAVAIANERWTEVTTSPSRTIIRDTPALREALVANGLKFKRDADLRKHLKEEAAK